LNSTCQKHNHKEKQEKVAEGKKEEIKDTGSHYQTFRNIRKDLGTLFAPVLAVSLVLKNLPNYLRAN
jgi:hypothetical protein